jgi:hypothetical protein
MVQRKARFFFGDLACKWYPYFLNLAEKIQLLQEERPGDVSAGTPKHQLLTPEDISSLRAVTSAVHSLTHVWYCQVRLLCIWLRWWNKAVASWLPVSKSATPHCLQHCVAQQSG